MRLTPWDSDRVRSSVTAGGSALPVELIVATSVRLTSRAVSFVVPTPGGTSCTRPNLVSTRPVIVMSLPSTAAGAAVSRRTPATKIALDVVADSSRCACWTHRPASDLKTNSKFEP